MEITSNAAAEAQAWLIASVPGSGTSWLTSDGQPRRQTDAEIDRKLPPTQKRPYLPAPEPGHVDFYA